MATTLLLLLLWSWKETGKKKNPYYMCFFSALHAETSVTSSEVQAQLAGAVSYDMDAREANRVREENHGIDYRF